MGEPGRTSTTPETKSRRRDLSTLFSAFLIAIAYQEMVNPVRESMQREGITVATVAMFIVFFVTSIRFLIGCHLHLTSDEITAAPGKIWLFDLVVITLEMTLIIFMGGVTSVAASSHSRLGFVEWLVLLYVLDVLWVVAQWGMHKLSPSWRRERFTWSWAILNAVFLALIWVMSIATGDLLTNTGLIALAVLSVLAFFVDVMFSDQYGLL